MASTKPEWADKHPSEMSNDELQDAKTALQAELVPAQDRVNVVSAAVAHIDAEITNRFQLPASPVPLGSLPEYPLDRLYPQV